MKENFKINTTNKTLCKIPSLTPPSQTFQTKLALFLLVISLSLSFFYCTRPTAPTANHCSTEDLVERLQTVSPSLSGCSPLSIRDADMMDLRDAGISNQQLLAVWSTNADIGFTSAQLLTAGITVAQMQSNDITLAQIHAGGVTPAQLLAAEITVAQMQTAGITLAQIHAGGVSIAHLLGTGMSITQLRTGGVPDYALFNEACNTPLSVGTSPGPRIKLLSTNLSPTNTQVVLGLRSADQAEITWTEITNNQSIHFRRIRQIPPLSQVLENIEAFYLRDERFDLVVEIHIPLTRVFFSTNFTVFVADSLNRDISLQLCSE